MVDKPKTAKELLNILQITEFQNKIEDFIFIDKINLNLKDVILPPEIEAFFCTISLNDLKHV